jgi:hypothetical protein
MTVKYKIFFKAKYISEEDTKKYEKLFQQIYSTKTCPPSDRWDKWSEKKHEPSTQ